MKKLLLSLIMLAVASCAMAQLLWKITAPGSRPSYLLGTCHFVDVAYADSIAGFDEAFLDCDTIYTEIGIPDAEALQSAYGELVQNLMAWPPLGSKLSEATADSLCAYILEHNGGDPAVVADDIRQLNFIMLMQKYPASNMLSAMQSGIAVEMPMDLGLVYYAAYLDMEGRALESVSYQLSLLSEFICNNAEEAVRGMIDSNPADDAHRLIADYKSGELDRLYGEFEKYRGLENMEELIDGRNRAWTDMLAPSLRSGGVFIAVGSGHLPGGQGLIELLRHCGFTVTAVDL